MIKKDIQNNINERERAIGKLMAGFKREETADLNQIFALEAELSPEELQISADTLAVMRIRALFSDGKKLQAYHALTEGLRQVPTSLSLHAERHSFLVSLQNTLSEQLHQDPMNPAVELLYNVMLKEGVVHVWHQVAYLQFLIGYGRYAEALKLALPLVVLSPSLLGLRGQVEVIAEKLPHPLLNVYLRTTPARLGRGFVAPQISSEDLVVLTEKLSSLREALRRHEEINLIEKNLKEVIGDLPQGAPLNTHLKEFYYLQAIVEERKQNYFEALQLFRALTEMDPCSLSYRQSLETEMTLVNNHLTEQAEKDILKVDLVSAYPVLKEIGHVSYPLLAQICIAEVRGGLKAQAKEKMQRLVSLNVMDSDYVGAALTVAEASEDVVWEADLLRCLERIREVRPWDLSLWVHPRMDGK